MSTFLPNLDKRFPGLGDTAKNLKSAQNIMISRLNIEPEAFTTSNLIHNYLNEFGMIGIGARIDNRDSTNTCTVRLHGPNGTARIIPAGTARIINEWFEQIHVEPHGTTGTGELQVELVRPEDARR